MITVTRLNDKPFVVNAELIRTVESNPDTTITLINGDHFIVKESMERVVELAIEYGRSLRKLLPPD
ncbi:MAG: flagellar FlbD family protein [Planctomycetota bacterium]